jgi:nitrite reductase/ring-hydroxylating ferredoxin subunit
MLIVRFDTRKINFLRIGDTPYFLLETGGGRRALVRDTCPHRGGPLHLACHDESGSKLICPWHEAKVAVSWLLGSAVPLVCAGNQAVAVFPVPPETRVRLVRRRIKSSLGHVRTSAGKPAMPTVRRRELGMADFRRARTGRQVTHSQPVGGN